MLLCVDCHDGVVTAYTSLSAYVELPPIADGYWKMVDRNQGTSAYTNVSLCVYDEATGAAYLLTMDI